MKPLSPKTLEKKYAELGLPKEKTDLLHEYFRCFSNLYGLITVRDAWNVFKHFEGIGLLRKKDFIAFSGIVQREPGHPYTVFELKEVFDGETTDDPTLRLIVNNRMIGHGHGKFWLLYNTEKLQAGKPIYLPPDKQAFLRFAEEQFYLSPEGQKVKRFLGRMKTNGKYKFFDEEPRGEILDLDGRPVAGKRLSEFVFYTQSELFEIDYAKRETEKERLRLVYSVTALDKLLDRIFIQIQTGGYSTKDTLMDFISFLVRYMDDDFGVALSQSQLETLLELLTNLNNNSHLWLNCGWRPIDLTRRSGGMPETITIGPNMKKMIEKGEIDRTEIERQFKEMGIKLID